LESPHQTRQFLTPAADGTDRNACCMKVKGKYTLPSIILTAPLAYRVLRSRVLPLLGYLRAEATQPAAGRELPERISEQVRVTLAQLANCHPDIRGVVGTPQHPLPSGLEARALLHAAI